MSSEISLPLLGLLFSQYDVSYTHGLHTEKDVKTTFVFVTRRDGPERDRSQPGRDKSQEEHRVIMGHALFGFFSTLRSDDARPEEDAADLLQEEREKEKRSGRKATASGAARRARTVQEICQKHTDYNFN